MILLKFILYFFLFFFIMGMVKVIMLLWRFRSIIKQIRKGQTSGQSGFGTWSWTNYSTDSNSSSTQTSSSETVSQGTAKPRKTLIPEDEGEYVEFEEIS